MPFQASFIATALYLMPVIIVVAAHPIRMDNVQWLAVDVPCTVALDLLIILALARVMRLDAAIVASRALWGAGAILLAGLRFRRRGPTPQSPRISVAAISILSGAVVIAVLLSVWRSRPYAIWDRQWHIPLVASLRGQRIPFVNVYQPRLRLGYHLSGDALAATLQVLSGVRLHASAALSLAHDILFGLTALSVAALIKSERAGGVVSADSSSPMARWEWLVAVAPLGVLLAGPLPTVGANGYSYLNYYEMSFRPHVVLAGLLITGITAAVLIAASRNRRSSPLGLLGPVLAMLSLLAITDEPSAAILILPLTSLVVAGRRGLSSAPWPIIAGSFATVVGLAIVAFPSTLGGPHVPLAVSAPHVPSLYAPTLPLLSLRGLAMLGGDTLPMVLILVVLGTMFARRRDLVTGVALAFGVAVLSVACLLLTTVVLARSPGESHRFMTLPCVVIPLSGLVAVKSARPWARVALALALGVPAISTIGWAMWVRPHVSAMTPNSYAPGIDRVDCRASTGARLFERVLPTYVPSANFYLWAGCRPVLAPGNAAGIGENVDVGRPLGGRAALSLLNDRFVPPEADLTVACPDTDARDPACRLGATRGECVRAGDGWRTCVLSPADRTELLTAWR